MSHRELVELVLRMQRGGAVVDVAPDGSCDGAGCGEGACQSTRPVASSSAAQARGATQRGSHPDPFSPAPNHLMSEKRRAIMCHVLRRRLLHTNASHLLQIQKLTKLARCPP